MEYFEIIKAERKDTLDILKCIQGIAQYEKLTDQLEVTEEILEASLFDRHEAEVLLAKLGEKTIGFALYFFNFSTFKGRKGLYLEDLFIFPDYRHQGYGKKLMNRLINEAALNHCGRMEWTCLNWNQPAIDFYLSLGAQPLSEWTIFRLDEKKILEHKQNSR